MTKHSSILSLALMLLALMSADAFCSMKRSVSKTALWAEVGDIAEMPAAEMPAADMPATEMPATEIPAVPEAVTAPAISTDTSMQIIPNNEFAPPVKAATTSLIAPDGTQPPPAPPINDLDTIALVVGQENYGFAIVLLGEAIWSFSKSPSVDHGLKTLLPAIVAAGILGVVSGPMVTSGDASTVGTGLLVATGVSVAMGLSYAARLSAPYSPSPKEIPALGLLVAVAGFFSFSQNAVYDGFVTLPSIPLPSLPSLPSIQLPF